MKFKYSSIISSYILAGVFLNNISTYAQQKLVMVREQEKPVIDWNHPDVLSSANLSGFETGHVVKINGVYHMFVNEMFNRPHRDMRIAYCTSPDAIN